MTAKGIAPAMYPGAGTTILRERAWRERGLLADQFR